MRLCSCWRHGEGAPVGHASGGAHGAVEIRGSEGQCDSGWAQPAMLFRSIVLFNACACRELRKVQQH
jgi:hypothetical protein